VWRPGWLEVSWPFELVAGGCDDMTFSGVRSGCRPLP
jgi:hypothetical protein